MAPPTVQRELGGVADPARPGQDHVTGASTEDRPQQGFAARAGHHLGRVGGQVAAVPVARGRLSQLGDPRHRPIAGRPRSSAQLGDQQRVDRETGLPEAQRKHRQTSRSTPGDLLVDRQRRRHRHLPTVLRRPDASPPVRWLKRHRRHGRDRPGGRRSRAGWTCSNASRSRLVNRVDRPARSWLATGADPVRGVPGGRDRHEPGDHRPEQSQPTPPRCGRRPCHNAMRDHSPYAWCAWTRGAFGESCRRFVNSFGEGTARWVVAGHLAALIPDRRPPRRRPAPPFHIQLTLRPSP